MSLNWVNSLRPIDMQVTPFYDRFVRNGGDVEQVGSDIEEAAAIGKMNAMIEEAELRISGGAEGYEGTPDTILQGAQTVLDAIMSPDARRGFLKYAAKTLPGQSIRLRGQVMKKQKDGAIHGLRQRNAAVITSTDISTVETDDKVLQSNAQALMALGENPETVARSYRDERKTLYDNLFSGRIQARGADEAYAMVTDPAYFERFDLPAEYVERKKADAQSFMRDQFAGAYQEGAIARFGQMLPQEARQLNDDPMAREPVASARMQRLLDRWDVFEGQRLSGVLKAAGFSEPQIDEMNERFIGQITALENEIASIQGGRKIRSGESPSRLDAEGQKMVNESAAIAANAAAQDINTALTDPNLTLAEKGMVIQRAGAQFASDTINTGFTPEPWKNLVNRLWGSQSMDGAAAGASMFMAAYNENRQVAADFAESGKILAYYRAMNAPGADPAKITERFFSQDPKTQKLRDEWAKLKEEDKERYFGQALLKESKDLDRIQDADSAREARSAFGTAPPAMYEDFVRRAEDMWYSSNGIIARDEVFETAFAATNKDWKRWPRASGGPYTFKPPGAVFGHEGNDQAVADLEKLALDASQVRLIHVEDPAFPEQHYRRHKWVVTSADPDRLGETLKNEDGTAVTLYVNPNEFESEKQALKDQTTRFLRGMKRREDRTAKGVEVRLRDYTRFVQQTQGLKPEEIDRRFPGERELYDDEFFRSVESTFTEERRKAIISSEKRRMSDPFEDKVFDRPGRRGI